MKSQDRGISGPSREQTLSTGFLKLHGFVLFFAGMTYQDDTWDWIVSHVCARNKTVQIEYVLSTLKFSDFFHLFHKLSL